VFVGNASSCFVFVLIAFIVLILLVFFISLVDDQEAKFGIATC